MTFDSNVLFRVSLGRNIGTTSKVSDNDVSAFLADVVSAHFQGFSVSFGLGYWQGKPEESVYIDILAEETAETLSSLEAITAEYNTRFSQDCVLVARTPVSTAFVSLRSTQVAKLA